MRLTQDCLENLFSQTRGLGDAHPSAVRFRLCLKHITLSQLLHVPRTTSYDVDSVPNLVDFIKKSKCEQCDTVVHQKLTQISAVVGSRPKYEEQALYYLCGWVAHKFTANNCDECKTVLCDTNPTLPQADFTVVRWSHTSKQIPCDSVVTS